MNRAAFVMNFVLLAIFLTMIIVATDYPAQARFMPFVVGIPASLLCLLQIFLDLRAARRNHPQPSTNMTSAITLENGEPTMLHSDAEKVQTATDGKVRREIALWSYFLGLIGGILVFGHWIAIPIFLIIFLHVEAELSRLQACFAAGVAISVLYVALNRGLGFALHGGFFPLFASW